jgi:acyl-homoserine lactone acylase PvdQ
MLIRLTRLTNERHRLELVRDDGTWEAHEMETRSALLHDLVHYAVETEAGLAASFYGRLASGKTYEALMTEQPADPEAMQTEGVVGRIQGIAKNDAWSGIDAESFAESIATGFRSAGDDPPVWLTGDLIIRVRERLRRVQGQWRATPFHQTLLLEFPARES